MTGQIATGFNIPDSEAGTFWQNFFYYIFQKNPVDYLRNLEYLLLPIDYMKHLPIFVWWRPVGWFFLILIATGFLFGRRPSRMRPLALLRSLQVHDWYVMGYVRPRSSRCPAPPPVTCSPSCRSSIFYVFKGVERICACFPESISPPHRFPRYLPLGKIITVFQRPVLARRSSVFVACVVSAAVLVRGFRIYQKPADDAGLSRILETLLRGQRLDEGQYAPPEPRHHAETEPGVVLVGTGSRWISPNRGSSQILRALEKYDYILLDNISFFPEKLKYVVPVIESLSGTLRGEARYEISRNLRHRNKKSGPLNRDRSCRGCRPVAPTLIRWNGYCYCRPNVP